LELHALTLVARSYALLFDTHYLILYTSTTYYIS